jgi:hypothetical protein
MDDLQKNLRERGIEKIRKLLAVARDGGASENEAATAARQAEKMMRALQIDASELVLKDMENDEAFERELAAASPDVRPRQIPTKVPAWVGIIAVGVARMTTTKVDVVRTPAGVMVRFSGYAMDTAFARWTFDYLIGSVYERSRKSFAGRGRGVASSFRLGAAQVLQTRLKAIADERDAEMRAGATPSDRTAMVVWGTKEKRVEEMFGEQKVESKRVNPVDAAAYAAGREAGAGMSIHTNRPIGSAPERRRIAP